MIGPILKRDDDRGQVGIGTLIVFIAMVLVAAIAAGVLINTAGFLQTKSEATGQDSTAQVSNRVTVVSGFGNVTSETVDEINMTVMVGSGSNDINLSKATIEWIGPNQAKTLSSGSLAKARGDLNEDGDLLDAGEGAGKSTYFNVSAIRDPSNSMPVLDEQDDRMRITINATAVGGAALNEGKTADLRLTTQYGAVTFYEVTVPPSLSDKSAVSV